MANEPVEPTVVEPVVEPEVKPEVKPAVEPVVKQPTKTEILRDLSKEIGLNLFEPEGLQKLKGLVDSQKTEQEKLQEAIDTLNTEKAEWQKTKLNYESKIEASKLGIHPDNIEDALKIAGGDPSKLADVIKKYPIFKAKNGITIGLQNPLNNKTPTSMSEAEAYMAKDPRYRNYLKK